MPESYLQYIYLKIYCYKKYWLCVIRVCVYTYTQTYTNIMYCWKEGHADSWKRSTRSVYPCYCLYNKQCSLLSVFPIVRNPGFFLLLSDKFTHYATKLKFEMKIIQKKIVIVRQDYRDNKKETLMLILCNCP